MKSKILLVIVAAFFAAASVCAVRWNKAGMGDSSPPCANLSHRETPPSPVIDLSATYGKVNQTIFNKRTRVVFAKPQEFFYDSGVNSFSGLRFDELRRLPADLRLVNGRRLTSHELDVIEERP